MLPPGGDNCEMWLIHSMEGGCPSTTFARIKSPSCDLEQRAMLVHLDPVRLKGKECF